MHPGNAADLIFAATLRPHRSLGRRGFLLLMTVIAGLWGVAGLYFVALGAWPVLGFVGLDVLAIFVAFRLNYRAARAYEDVEVSRSELLIRKVAPNGRAEEFRLNPAWARLELQRAADEGVTRITVRNREARVPVGAFLNPDDRQSFAQAFGTALAEARR